MPPLLSNALSEAPGRTERSSRNRNPPIVGATPGLKSRTHPDVVLQIETLGFSNRFAIAPDVLDWSEIVRGMDGAETTAALIVRALDASKLTTAGNVGSEHFTALLEQLDPTRRVRIAVTRGADAGDILFQGFPLSRTPSWSERHQSITVQCVLEGQELLRTSTEQQIIERRMRFNPAKPWDIEQPDLVRVASEPVVFNAGGRPNKLDQPLRFSDGNIDIGVPAFTDDEAADAALWNHAEALRYVCFHYIHNASLAEVNVEDFLFDTTFFVDGPPAPHTADAFTRRMTSVVQDVSVQSVNAEEAIRLLCEAAGLHYEIAIRTSGDDPEYYLRVFHVLENEDEENASRSLFMATPVVRDIHRDTPFTNYATVSDASIAERNEARQSQLTIDSRAVTAPIYLAGARDFEVTLPLRPGWTPHEKLDNVTTDAGGTSRRDFWENEFFEGEEKSIYHGSHPQFAANADVGRLWIFPDDGRYIDADLLTSAYARDVGPWAAALYSPYRDWPLAEALVYADERIGGGIDPEELATWRPGPRPFRNTIGRANTSTTDRAPIVRFHFGFNPNDPTRGTLFTDPLTILTKPGWVEYKGNKLFDARRAALWITEDDLWGSPNLLADPDDPHGVNMLRAYLGESWTPGVFGLPHFFVSVTCTVRGDKRMTYRPHLSIKAIGRQRRKVIDLGYEQFVSRKRRGQNSHLDALAADADPTFEDRDDTDRLTAYGDAAQREMDRETVSGSIDVPYVKTDVRIGDSFSGVAGLGIRFSSFPAINTIQFVKDPGAGYRTVYHLTDLRHSPEVGSE